MTSYCLLADLKTYLNVTSSSDDVLIQVLLDAATARINSKTGRNFLATTNTTRYYNPNFDVYSGELWLDEDLSYLASVVNGDSANITASTYTKPTNETPYHRIGINPSSSYYWTYTTNPEASVSVSGRFAYMARASITSIARSSNVVTAQVQAPQISVGMQICVVGVADSSFDGLFTVVSNNGTAITWAQTAGNDTDTDGVLLFTPVDIVTACRRLAAWMYRQKDTQSGDLDRPLLAGDGTVIMPTNLPLDVEHILRPYARLVR